MGDTEEEMSDSLDTQQQNDRPQSPGKRMRSKQKSDCQQRGGNYDAESEKDSSEPKGKVADSKSKVNCYKFTLIKLYLHVMFQGKENIVAEDVDWMEKCKNLLNTLCDSENSIAFRQPVKLLNVPYYLQVIDQPMNLQTVREKLEADNYATPSEFANDVHLIFENFKRCNPIRKLKKTIELSLSFEDHMRHILDSYKRRKAAVES